MGASSPTTGKAGKKGKKDTNWDPFIFGGRGATGEEAKNLERGPKASPGGRNGNEDDEEFDPQLHQFVPDASVIGNSASKIFFSFRTIKKLH